MMEMVMLDLVVETSLGAKLSDLQAAATSKTYQRNLLQ